MHEKKHEKARKIIVERKGADVSITFQCEDHYAAMQLFEEINRCINDTHSVYFDFLMEASRA
jgi:hypothetical protein